MVLGELGRLPIEYNVNCRMLGFWYKMICDNDRKISSTLYKLLYNLHIHDRYSSKWIDKVKCILTECGMSDFWYDQSKVKSLTFCNFL